MKMMFLSIAALALAPAAVAAEPVVLPEFSFDTTDNFALSVMLQNQVMDRLIADGHIVLTQEVVSREVGAAAVAQCMENPACPGQVLPKLPSRVAVVTRVLRESGTLVGHVEIWEQSRSTAMEVLDIPIAPGEEPQFVEEVSVATNRLIQQLPPSSNETLMAAARLIAGGSAAAGPPVPAPGTPPPAPVPGAITPAPIPGAITPAPVPGAITPAPVPSLLPPAPGSVPVVQPGPVAPVVPVPAVATTPSRRGGAPVDYATTDVRQALEGTGVRYRHVQGAQGSLRRSGMDPRDWLYKATPHAGRMVFEARAGLGIGAVDRQADVRLALNAGEKSSEWYQEGPIDARRLRGGVYVGYAPVAAFDIGAMLGIQYGKRWFTTGFFIVDEDEGQVQDLQSVDAIQFIIQPRARLYVVPTGPAKPFIVAGGDFRMFDKYQLAVTEGPTYPTPAGGVVPGVMGGAGLLIDPSPIFGFFVEGSYIHHLGLRAASASYLDWTYGKPGAPEGSPFTISVVGGLQFRL